MLKKIALIFPRDHDKTGDPPLGILSLAAYLTARVSDIDVTVIDTTFQPSLRKVEETFKALRPNIVGIYFDITLIARGKEIARMARACGAVVVAGGPYATIMPESLVDDVDMVVMGEGELTLEEIVRNYPDSDIPAIKGIVARYEGQILRTERHPFLPDLDTLPFIDFSLVDIEQYKRYWYYFDSLDVRYSGSTLMVSRGCHFNCTYCQPTLREIFGSRIRYKTPGRVVEELAYYKKCFGVKHFFFHDDSLTAHTDWIETLCDMLLHQGVDVLWGCNSRVDALNKPLLLLMYRAGLRNIHFGVESGCQRVIDEVYAKNITLKQARESIADTASAGIIPMGFFMIGAPGETVSEIYTTIRFSNELPLKEASFSLTTPLPGTYLYDTMLHNGDDTELLGLNDSNYHTTRSFRQAGGIPNWQVLLLHKYALLRFYLDFRRLRYIARHLISPTGWRKLAQKIRRFF